MTVTGRAPLHAGQFSKLDIIQFRSISSSRYRTFCPLPFSLLRFSKCAIDLNSLIPKPRRYCRSNSSDSFDNLERPKRTSERMLSNYAKSIVSTASAEDSSIECTEQSSATKRETEMIRNFTQQCPPEKLEPEISTFENPTQRIPVEKRIKAVVKVQERKKSTIRTTNQRQSPKAVKKVPLGNKKFKTTTTWTARRNFNMKRLEGGDHQSIVLKRPLKRNPACPYKENKASILRSKCRAEEAVIPLYVTQHFDKFHKPPFKTNGAACRRMVKCVNNKLRR